MGSDAVRWHADANCSVVAGRAFPFDRQPQPRAVAADTLAAVEPFEHACALALWNAGSIVLDAEKDGPGIGTTANGDCAARPRVAQRVVDQVVQHVGKERLVAVDAGAGELEAE